MKKILGFASLGTAGAAAVLAMSLNAAPVAAQEVTLYKNPQCGCCESYADYLRENGFTVEVKPTHDLAQISRDAGIPDDFQGCHTGFLDDYVISGHVPIDVVNRLLEERPEIAGDSSRHAIGVAGYGRRETGALQDLHRRGRCEPDRIFGRMINRAVWCEPVPDRFQGKTKDGMHDDER